MDSMNQASARFEQGKQALNVALTKSTDAATKELIRGIFHFNYAVGLALAGIHEELQNLKKMR